MQGNAPLANKFGRYPALLAVAATAVPKYNKLLSHFYSAVFITEQSVTTAADDTADEKVQKNGKINMGNNAFFWPRFSLSHCRAATPNF